MQTTGTTIIEILHLSPDSINKQFLVTINCPESYNRNNRTHSKPNLYHAMMYYVINAMFSEKTL
mgnify:CR=1 FL=1